MEIPETQELADSLKILCAWATGGNRTGNPYGHEPVKQALTILDRWQGGSGEWGNAITDPNVKVVTIPHLVLRNVQFTDEAIKENDMDTAESDGSGTFRVIIVDIPPQMHQSDIEVGVQIMLEGEYATKWDWESIKLEAQSMLIRDYCEAH